MLAYAAASGIHMLDTAPGYGDIEQRLASLAAADDFRFVSKIPALVEGMGAPEAIRFVRESVLLSRDRLGARLKTILFHRGEDLICPLGEVLWHAAAEAAKVADVRIGASCYSPHTAMEIRRRFTIEVMQLPGNALDQRLAEPAVAAALVGAEIHVRSAFLQGLLLLPLARVVERLPRAARAAAAWIEWCDAKGQDPLRAALGAVKALPSARYCVVGADNLHQLEEIVRAWREAEPNREAALATVDEDVIDPRRWTQ